jgi:catechol 2,3-dioxygenase-like lactoylglutathione lyase family enzyme
MGRVTGLGGVFFKAEDPEKLHAWYESHLGMKREGGPVFFRWREKENDAPGTTVWSLFSNDTKYFDPSKAAFMLNYRVDNLDALLDQLRAAGVWVDERREDSEYGRFAWIMDPEGNRIELWEPPKGS